MGSSKGPRSDRSFNFVKPERYIAKGDQMRAKAAKRAMFARMGDQVRDKEVKQPSAPKCVFQLQMTISINEI